MWQCALWTPESRIHRLDRYSDAELQKLWLPLNSKRFALIKENKTIHFIKTSQESSRGRMIINHKSLLISNDDSLGQKRTVFSEHTLWPDHPSRSRLAMVEYILSTLKSNKSNRDQQTCWQSNPLMATRSLRRLLRQNRLRLRH